MQLQIAAVTVEQRWKDDFIFYQTTSVLVV